MSEDRDQDRPATVSEVCFIPESFGTCPECGRASVYLGRVNVTDPGSRRVACIHCYFGPPGPEMWDGFEDYEEYDDA